MSGHFPAQAGGDRALGLQRATFDQEEEAVFPVTPISPIRTSFRGSPNRVVLVLQHDLETPARVWPPQCWTRPCARLADAGRTEMPLPSGTHAGGSRRPQHGEGRRGQVAELHLSIVQIGWLFSRACGGFEEACAVKDAWGGQRWAVRRPRAHEGVTAAAGIGAPVTLAATCETFPLFYRNPDPDAAPSFIVHGDPARQSCCYARQSAGKL